MPKQPKYCLSGENGVDGKGVAKGIAQSVLHPLLFMQFQARTLYSPESGPYTAQLAQDRAAARRSLLDDVTGAEEAETLTAAATGLEPLAPGCTR